MADLIKTKEGRVNLIIRMTEEDVTNGTDQPNRCPVAIAGTRALREAGYDDLNIEWEPYRAFCEPAGLTVWKGRTDRPYGDKFIARVPVGEVPYEAYEFSSEFDDWYRQDGGEEDGPPSPITFAVDLPLLSPTGKSG